MTDDTFATSALPAMLLRERARKLRLAATAWREAYPAWSNDDFQRGARALEAAAAGLEVCADQLVTSPAVPARTDSPTADELEDM